MHGSYNFNDFPNRKSQLSIFSETSRLFWKLLILYSFKKTDASGRHFLRNVKPFLENAPNHIFMQYRHTLFKNTKFMTLKYLIGAIFLPYLPSPDVSSVHTYFKKVTTRNLMIATKRCKRKKGIRHKKYVRVHYIPQYIA